MAQAHLTTALVINLNRSTARWEMTERRAQVAGLLPVRLAAVEPVALNAVSANLGVLVNPQAPLQMSATLSHLLAWQWLHDRPHIDAVRCAHVCCIVKRPSPNARMHTQGQVHTAHYQHATAHARTRAHKGTSTSASAHAMASIGRRSCSRMTCSSTQTLLRSHEEHGATCRHALCSSSSALAAAGAAGRMDQLARAWSGRAAWA